MFLRVREITDAVGARLRLRVEEHPSGALVTLERPDQRRAERVMLDGYGAEILWGFIMSARLAVEDDLADERVDGCFPARLQLSRDRGTSLVITQAALERPFEIPAGLWDRLYAELCLVTAHARELERRKEAWVH